MPSFAPRSFSPSQSGEPRPTPMVETTAPQAITASATAPMAEGVSFEDFGLPQTLMNSLKAIQFNHPTPIQAAAIPPALEGRDILGSAQTGTGKTGAFGIPMITRLLTNPRGTALVMTPTRELAVQVIEMMEKLLGKSSPIRAALLIGGEPMPKQLQQLRMRPRVIVGTPGRINDHLERGSLMLHDASFLVLDETDRMLDMGFGIQIDKVLKFMPPQRQTLLFSATLPDNIVKLSNKYLTNPVRVSVGSTVAVATNIQQQTIRVSEGEKFNTLLQQLKEREGSVIVFVKTKWGAEKLADKLCASDFSADAIHGDLRQNQRDRAIAAFRLKRFRIMVATDIAARGLDIPHIEHVINYDLPQVPEDYIHRIGRTARAGAEGHAVNLVTPADGIKWRAILKLIDPEAFAREQAERKPRPMGAEGRKGKPGGGFRPRRSGGSTGGHGGQRREGAPRRENGHNRRSQNG